MWTYVKITFNCAGPKASEIYKVFKELGFKPTLGNYDFVYSWKEKDIPPEASVNFIEGKVIKLIEDVQAKLEGKNVLLRFTTFKLGK